MTEWLIPTDYNTRVVLAGTTLLGTAAGVAGVFLILRGRALLGDIIGHATLPGLAGAFLVGRAVDPDNARSTPLLVAGAMMSGAAGAGSVSWLTRRAGLKDDAALAIVLGLFFGGGAALFNLVQQLPGANSAGLGQFMFGKAASMLAADVQTFAVVAVVVIAAVVALRKELTLLCFDPDYLAATGRSPLLLDLALAAIVLTVSVAGLWSVGLILVVATLVIPAAAARNVTDRIGRMLLLSGLFGFAGAYIGTLVSASAPRMSTGGVVVLADAAIFVAALLYGTARKRLAARRIAD
ncbi:MAG: metal ABC transporter permease [Planctomycetota bacterium]